MVEERDLNTLDKDALIGIIRELETKIGREGERCRKQEQMMTENKQAAMSQMVAAIAHRWRQPLTVIGFILQNIQGAQEMGKLDHNYIAQSVESGMEQIKILSNTIDELGDYLKPISERKSFDVTSVITETISLLNAQLQNNCIDMTMNFAPKTGVNTIGLISQFKLVLINMVNNGITAIKKKIEKGLMTRGQGEIRMDLIADEEEIIITIRNNGDTIPGDILDRIFEPFFVTDKFRQIKGVGLYMAKTIIEGNMNGKIYARNHEEGVVFTIHLDRHRGPK